MEEIADIDAGNPEPGTSDGNAGDPAIAGWTKHEKFELLQALKSYGSSDINSIQESIPTKTTEQIITAIAYYKKKAMRSPGWYSHETRRMTTPRVPLASWAKYLTDTLGFDDLETETAQALRLIADLEEIPPAVCTGNIDFRRIYHSLANALEGKPIENDKLTSMVLDKCIMETAVLSKCFIRNSTLKFMLDNVDVDKKDLNYFPKPTDNYEVIAIRHLASQRNYNPLRIEEKFLKSSK